MPLFRVTWVIDIEADTPEQAALLSLRIQRDVESIATCFTVEESTNPVPIEIDIDPVQFSNV